MGLVLLLEVVAVQGCRRGESQRTVCLPSHMSPVMGVIMKYLAMCGPDDGMNRFEFKRRFDIGKEESGEEWLGSSMSDGNLLD